MHVFIAVPAYSWVVYLPTMRSVIGDMTALMQQGAQVSLHDESGSTDLPEARALILDDFLKSDATHLFCIDNDVFWQAGAMSRLLKHNRNFVAAVYPKRQDPIEFPVVLENGPRGDLIEAVAVPFGFVCLSRECATRMAEAYAGEAFTTNRHGADRQLLRVFDPVTIDGRRKGEDFSFCHRWRQLGGQIWVDPGVTMGHIGPKMFIGQLSDAIDKS